MKKALITGITGQDGSYLAELLLAKGYEVHGIIRRSSNFNTVRIDHLYQDPHENERRLFLHFGDLLDSANLARVVERVAPHEVYNLGAQSHVQVSFEMPEYTANVDAIGTTRMLEAIKDTGVPARFYQASTSELFGKVQETPQRETTPFRPCNPYAVAKLYAFWTTVNYREAHGIFACNGILFNHESERRGETFVTRKITRAAGRIKHGLQEKLFLGSLASQRDWGYAPEYVEGMWRMLQQDEADDFVLATGVTTSIEAFCQIAFEHAGINLRFEGEGTARRGIGDAGRVLVEIDPRYFRPADTDTLKGDASKAREQLAWEAATSVDALARVMTEHDVDLARREASASDRF